MHFEGCLWVVSAGAAEKSDGARMKVLHVLYKLMPSGAEKMLSDAVALFRENGVEGWILANDDEEGPYADVLKSCGYRVVQIPWSRARWHLVDFFLFCRREKIQVVHIHVIRGYLGFAIAARLAGVKVVVKTFHGNFIARDKIRWVWHVIIRGMAKVAGARMVAISRSVQDNERETFKNKCQLAWNFSDESKFPIADKNIGYAMREILGVEVDSFVLLSVGNCHSESHCKIKNHQLILHAIALLPDAIKKKVVYLHVGSEMEGYPERKLAKNLGIETQVRFLGSRCDIWKLLCAADVYVMSSLQEGLGNSTIEAAFSGREMILTKVKGLVDFQTVIPFGLSYCDLTPESMASVITDKFKAKNDLEGNMDIRESALKTFALSSGVNRLVSLYKGEGG